MQTFLPLKSFEKSAECLDYRRLGKQRVETWQLLLIMVEGRKAWSNHPAFLMWEGYDFALAKYGIAICREWKKRGYKDTLEEKFLKQPLVYKHFEYPNWLGNEKFHASHRSALLYKDFEYYSRFGWSENPELNYVWPVRR
jgi:hypothetical protein